MLKRFLPIVKQWMVNRSKMWFYSSQKLPVGTHFPLFTAHRLLFELEVVFDVGANQGHFSKELSRYHPKSTFYCFEPFPETFDILKVNLPESNFHHFKLALGDIAETIMVSQNDANQSDTNTLVNFKDSGNQSNKVSIQINTLDKFIIEHSMESIDLLKIDTEGFDLKVLKGAEKILKKGLVKLIYVECGLDPSNTYHVFFPEILNYLNPLNYVFVGFFQTDIRKIDRKIHFSNALFVHHKVSDQLKTYL
jgi:FkbM family methyltransferase